MEPDRTGQHLAQGIAGVRFFLVAQLLDSARSREGRRALDDRSFAKVTVTRSGRNTSTCSPRRTMSSTAERMMSGRFSEAQSTNSSMPSVLVLCSQ